MIVKLGARFDQLRAASKSTERNFSNILLIAGLLKGEVVYASNGKGVTAMVGYLFLV